MPTQRPDMPTTIAGRSTRMEVLELLRRKGDASAETISSDLGVTPNAVRQHLTNLEREGFVVSHPERRRRGRPSLLFSLTERADSVFPKRYGQLASMVLQEVQDMGGHRPARPFRHGLGQPGHPMIAASQRHRDRVRQRTIGQGQILPGRLEVVGPLGEPPGERVRWFRHLAPLPQLAD